MGLSENLQSQINSLHEEKEALKQVLSDVKAKMDAVNIGTVTASLQTTITNAEGTLNVLKQADYAYASVFSTKTAELLKSLNRVNQEVNNRKKEIDNAKTEIEKKIQTLESQISTLQRQKKAEDTRLENEKAKKANENK